MNARQAFIKCFGSQKAVLAMLHLKGSNDAEILDRAKREIELYHSQGVTAVIVENYFNQEETKSAEMVLRYLQENRQDVMYGVNMLEHDQAGFEAAAEYGASFLQLDSVAGHLTPDEDILFGEQIAKWRTMTNALVLGGVRFKYQPYRSGRSLEEDLNIGMTRCDAIVVTGAGTGMETSMDKIIQFRQIIGDFPLVVGAGMTPENCAERLNIADGAIVGSYFKDTFADTGEVDVDHIRTFMNAVHR